MSVTAPTDQLVITACATGHVLQDYHTTPFDLVHAASCFFTTLSMDSATGTLRLRRGDRLVFQGDIMALSILSQPTPALRFVELANLMVG